MLILVINCGSSSVKYELFGENRDSDLFSLENRSLSLFSGSVERIGEKGSSCKNHYEAVGVIRKRLFAPDKKRIIRKVDDIKGIGHRIVHGGEEFSKATEITRGVLKSIARSSKLAPLHNPSALEGIKACARYFRGIRQVAVFDTAFHQSLPAYAYLYGIPFSFYKKYKIRKYGFHGTSHRFVASEAAKKLGKSLTKLKIITVHLGNGCSMAAISGGKSIDTTMGFTPLEGLLMGTRTGDMDPAIVTFLMEKEGLSVNEMNEVMNNKSGLLGLSGVSNDMRDIARAAKKGNKRAHTAFKIFVYRIKKYIGAYAAVLGGLDGVVFTGGIGENMPEIKKTLAANLRPLLGNKVKFLTIPTNEELLIARDTYKLIKKTKTREYKNAKSKT
ncbi:MAG: acetate kinase [Omnitrophica bacterium]|nr:acetate kinase [Candidatus Omnitrophota bacterium]